VPRTTENGFSPTPLLEHNYHAGLTLF
jgi:hypothetical protein